MTHVLGGMCSRARCLWLIVAAVLIAVGFAVDGTTEAGHHLGLILGGIAAGIGLARS